MNTKLRFNAEETADIEPYEWEPEQEGRNGSRISPFAVPIGAYVESPKKGLVSRIRFSYPGGKSTHLDDETDNAGDIPITIRVSRATQKIVEIVFSSPVDADGLELIAKRLEDRGNNYKIIAKKFSFQMIARLLDQDRKKIVDFKRKKRTGD